MGKLADSMIEHGIAKGTLLNSGKAMCLVGHAFAVFAVDERGRFATMKEEETWVEVLDSEGYDAGYYDYLEVEQLLTPQEYLDQEGGDSTEYVWSHVPQSHRAVILDAVKEVTHDLFPVDETPFSFEEPWEFNDSSSISEDDILRVGKLVDERLDELGLA